MALFLELLQRIPRLSRRDALPRQPNPTFEISRQTRDNQQRRCIQQHEIKNRNQVLRDMVPARQQPFERPRILLRLPTSDARQRVRRQPKLRWVQRELRNDPILRQRPRMRLARAAHLVQPLRPTHHQRAPDTRVPQAPREGLAQRRVRDAEDHPVRVRRVDERAQDVEHRPEGERLAVRGEQREGGVVVWGEDECEGHAPDVGGDGGGGRGEFASEGLEEVGRT